MYKTISNLNYRDDCTDISLETTISLEEELSELELGGIVGGVALIGPINKPQIADGTASANVLALVNVGVQDTFEVNSPQN